MTDLILDLKLNNLVFTVTTTGVMPGRIVRIEENQCRVFIPEIDEIRHCDYDHVYPLKITPRWLRANQFMDPDEQDPFKRYQHSVLPIIYDFYNKILHIRGKQFPVKINFVHHFQNALIDSGIQSPFNEIGTSPQVDITATISRLIGGFRKDDKRDEVLIDTNMLFGITTLGSGERLPGGANQRAMLAENQQNSNKQIAADIIKFVQQLVPEELRALENIRLRFRTETNSAYIVFVDKEERVANPYLCFLQISNSAIGAQIIKFFQDYYNNHLHKNLSHSYLSMASKADMESNCAHSLRIDRDLRITVLNGRRDYNYPSRIGTESLNTIDSILQRNMEPEFLKVQTRKVTMPNIEVQQAPDMLRENNEVAEEADEEAEAAD